MKCTKCSERGVRQGCCMSSTLFNIYSEALMTEVLEGTDAVIIGGERIMVIKYGDDWTGLASHDKDFQNVMTRITRKKVWNEN